jgi:hypothetical protein
MWPTVSWFICLSSAIVGDVVPKPQLGLQHAGLGPALNLIESIPAAEAALSSESHGNMDVLSWGCVRVVQLLVKSPVQSPAHDSSRDSSQLWEPVGPDVMSSNPPAARFV